MNRLEGETVGELQKANSARYRRRNRAQMLKLNAQDRNVPGIAQIFNWQEKENCHTGHSNITDDIYKNKP